MASRGCLALGGLKLLIVDEADQMLSEGFREQLLEILAMLEAQKARVQVALFSATMNTQRDVVELAEKFTQNPVRISTTAPSSGGGGGGWGGSGGGGGFGFGGKCAPSISHWRVDVSGEDPDAQKVAVLLDLYSHLALAQTIIFVSTRQRVELLAEEMRKEHHTVAMVHGSMEPADIQAVLKSFCACEARVLIASGYLSRGFDCVSVGLVVNFDLPRGDDPHAEYVHRVGRTGRANKKGHAITFVKPRDAALLMDIEDKCEVALRELPADLASLSS